MSSTDVERIKEENKKIILHAFNNTAIKNHRMLNSLMDFISYYKDLSYKLSDGKIGTALAVAGEIGRFDIVEKLVTQSFVDLDRVVWTEDESEVMNFENWLESIAIVKNANGEATLSQLEMLNIKEISRNREEKGLRRIG